MSVAAVLGRRSRSTRQRRRLAAIRLVAANKRFERSVATLRRAALDQVDRQVMVSTALRMAADSLAARSPL